MSIYLLMDTKHILYHNRLRELSNDLDVYGGKFIPRLNVDGTKCLLQVKTKLDKYDWINYGNPGLLGKGNKNWALVLTTYETEWTKKAYNDWKVHRDFCTGKINKEKYEQLLEEGRGTITLKKTKE